MKMVLLFDVLVYFSERLSNCPIIRTQFTSNLHKQVKAFAQFLYTLETLHTCDHSLHVSLHIEGVRTLFYYIELVSGDSDYYSRTSLTVIHSRSNVNFVLYIITLPKCGY